MGIGEIPRVTRPRENLIRAAAGLGHVHRLCALTVCRLASRQAVRTPIRNTPCAQARSAPDVPIQTSPRSRIREIPHSSAGQQAAGSIYDALGDQQPRQVGPGTDLKLAVNAGQMRLDGLPRKEHGGGRFGVVQAVGNHPRNLQLLGR